MNTMDNLRGVQNYKYEKELGIGISSFVSLVQNKNNNQHYALKCLRLRKRILKQDIPNIYINLEFFSVISKNDFNNEVNLHILLNTKNIGPKLYTFWIENGFGYMLLEVWDRCLSFNDILSEDLSVKLQNQLTEFHKCGYLHLDIKLDNVLVKIDDKNEIIDLTLTDFGLMPCLINDAKTFKNGDYIEICKNLNYFPKNPEKIDNILLEKMKTSIIIKKNDKV